MSSAHKTFDLIALGPTHIDLCGEQVGASLHEMLSFKKFIAGSAATVAIGCSRLKFKTALISSISADEMGSFILQKLQQEKVDCSHVKRIPHKLLPLLLRPIDQKNESNFLYYGENAASFALSPADIHSHFMAKSQVFLVTSACFSHDMLSQSARKAILAAKENGSQIILLIDYQSYSWPAEKKTAAALTAALEPVIPLCDIIIGTDKEFQLATAAHNIPEAIKQLQSQTQAILILRNSEGCYAFSAQSPWQGADQQPTSKEDPVYQAGMDAFTAGFLKGWFQKNTLEKCCQLGLACQAIAHTRHHHVDSLPSEEELFLYMTESQQLVGQTLKSAHFNHIHYATTRPRSFEQHFVFHFGPHQLWQKLGENHRANEATLQKAKALVIRGLNIAAEQTPFAAVILDEKAPLEWLKAQQLPYRLLRSVETPGEVPLQFKNDPDVTQTLLQWPSSHGVKVTIIYHPDDRYALRGQQEATLSLLHRACRTTKHELFVELCPPTNSLITASTVAHIMHRFYEIGVYPDGWLMSTPRDQRTWDSITRSISENDPYCQGVVITAQTASLEQLSMIFEMAAKQKHCKGFVVGRNVFQQPLDQWLAQHITDHTFMDMVATNFHNVVNLWAKFAQVESNEKELFLV